MAENVSVNLLSSRLNQQQKLAVETTEGPLLIIAGPGSGKTFTLVERIFYLINQKKIPAENILVATFTEKAAQELISRVSNRLLKARVSVNLNDMYIGTVHSICLRFLDEYREYTRLKRNYSLMDQFDQQYFLYQRIYDYQQIENSELIIGELKSTSRWDRAESLMKWLNKVSEECIDIEQLLSSSNAKVKVLGECYKLYQEQLLEENALDFSTIQVETLRLLENNPAVLQKLQQKIKYIMIDEYQDTNTVQEQILFLLAGHTQNICVVGDDDQGLYRFRGATIRNILEFTQNFPDGYCKRVELVTNYRSHPTIIDFYNNWMKLNNWTHEGQSFRFNKVILPRNGEFPDTQCVIKVSGQDGYDNWYDEVYSFLQTLKSSNKLSDWNQVAFLFRSVKNDKVVELAHYLEDKGIPVYSPRSNMFFEREEVRLMIGALIFLFPQFPHVRKWNENAYLPEWEYYDSCFRAFAELLRLPENKELLVWCRGRAKTHLNLSENTDYGFGRLFYELLQFPVFSRYLQDNSASGVVDSRPARNLALFSKLLTKFEYLHHISVLTPKYLEKNLRDLFNEYFRFLMDGGINEYEDSSEYAPSGCVSFLTIHQSKGLEFPIVFVGSLNDTPRKQYTELDELLQNEYYRKPPFEPIEKTKNYDFWRLYYTAFSRAQNLLVLTCQEYTPKGKGQKHSPSKYFQTLYNELPYWTDETVDINKITFEKVKAVNLKKEYSFTSHISLFENCAIQYRFFKELEFSPVRHNATLFGMLVHQTIEDIHKTVLRNEEHLITEENIEAWFNKNYVYLTKKERVYLAPQIQQVALKQILRYVERQGGDWSRIKEAEVDVSLVKENYILKGTIDLIRGENGTVEIVDFKSEKKPDLFSDRERLERYRRQLEVYAHLVESRTGQKVSKLHIYYTGENDGNPYVTFNKNSKSIDQTIEAFDRIVDKIERKEFTITERPTKLCVECDMRFYCDRQ
jgi:DNA helicase II / ATP-dependent DNA helicase PcrA